VFHEASPDSIEEEAKLLSVLSERIGAQSSNIQTGIGPYAVYSLSPDAHAELAEFGRKNGYLWASHVAESSEELQAFSDQTGDLFFQITRRKPWPFGKVTRGSMDFALSRNLIPRNAICFHCNYVNGAELERLAGIEASVVLCFQYSSETGHKAFPLNVAMKRGVVLCAATESMSCERSMNLFDELFCARQNYPHIPASEMIRWITVNPARALGAASQIGSLGQGMRADIIGLKFPQKPGTFLLDELIVGEPEVKLVIVDGEEIIADY
jgi:cytosine/adenosine deaminase-related metal-dependent hydrolase